MFSVENHFLFNIHVHVCLTLEVSMTFVVFFVEVLTVLNGGLGWLHQVSLCHVRLGR